MKLDASLWGKLPAELLEQVLPFLPVPDLCRFRSVCKRWNTLICTPEFGTLCMQKGSNKACFVAKLRLYSRLTRRSTEIPSWGMFDLQAKRWYNIKHELPEDYDYDMPAMDAGLVCTFVNTFTDEQRQISTIRNSLTNDLGQTLVVFNLLENKVKSLPNPPLGRIDLPYLHLKLVVDNTSRTYKVFVLRVGYFWDYSGHPFMSIFESATNKWRNPANPPTEPRVIPGKLSDNVRSAVYRGEMEKIGYDYWAVLIWSFAVKIFQ